jgi:hypothetical protein
MREYHAYPHHSVAIDGRIIGPHLSCFVPCVLRVLSEDVALVSTADWASLPDRVYLWQARTGIIFKCGVEWEQDGTLFGLNFIDDESRPRRQALIQACVGIGSESAFAPRLPVTAH